MILERPDKTVIMLGINDCFNTDTTSLQTIDSVIDLMLENTGLLLSNLIASNEDMEIGVCLIPPANIRKFAFYDSYGDSLKQRAWRMVQHRLNQKYIEYFSQNFRSNCSLIPVEIDIDTWTGYGCCNAIHPKEYGYHQIAKSVFNWVYFQINRSNTPPVITSASFVEIEEDMPLSYFATATDNEDFPSLRFKSLPSWIHQEGTQLLGVPREPDRDTSFVIIASDGELRDTLSVYVSVISVNDAPNLSVIPAITFEEDENLTLQYSEWYEYVDDMDNTDEELVWDIYAGRSVSVEPEVGEVRISSPANWNGQDTIQVVVSDAEYSDTTSVVVVVTPVNDAPLITSSTELAATEDVYFSYTGTATDIEDSTLTWVFSDLPGWLMSAADSVFGIPLEGASDTSFQGIVSDGELSDTILVAIQLLSVNDAPNISMIPSITFEEDGNLTIQYSEWYEFVDDLDNADEELVWDIHAGRNVGVEPAIGEVRITSPANWNGQDTIQVVVSDTEYSDTTSVVVMVTPVNDAPMITSSTELAATEDVYLSYRGTATDIEDSTLTWLFSDLPGWLMSAADSVFGVPLEGASDTSFQGIVSDGELSDTILVSIQIFPVNDPPVFSVIPPITFEEDDTLSFQYSEWFEYVQDMDNTDEALVWQMGSGRYVIPEVNSDQVTFRSPSNWNGRDTLQVVVSDAEYSDTTNVVVIVPPVNDAPMITSSTALVATEDVYISYAGTATDIEDSTLTWVFSDLPAWLMADADSVFGVPLEGTSDTSFQAIVSDESLSDTTIISLHISAINDRPILANIPDILYEEDDTLTTQYSAWYEYVDDVDNSDEELEWDIIVGRNVSVAPVIGAVRITSPANWNGRDTLQVVVSDAEYSDTTSVVVIVTPVNDAPGPFSLVLPSTGTVVENSDSTMQTFSWQRSQDIDGDSVSYTLRFSSMILDSMWEYHVVGLDTNFVKINIEGFPRNTDCMWSVIARDSELNTNSLDTNIFRVLANVGMDLNLKTPDDYYLSQNFPNPFNPYTTIQYGLPEISSVNITIYDIRGKEVKIWDITAQEAGVYQYVWNGLDNLGRPVATGIYLTRIHAGQYSETIKMLYLK